MKYFFLAENWIVSRVWGKEGLWNHTAWRRQPDIHRMDLAIVEGSQTLYLYRVEDAVLMVEVKPETPQASNTEAIGQVVLKRLIDADRVLERLSNDLATCRLQGSDR